MYNHNYGDYGKLQSYVDLIDDYTCIFDVDTGDRFFISLIAAYYPDLLKYNVCAYDLTREVPYIVIKK